MAFNEPGRGSLFPNKFRSEGDNKPVMKGEIFAHRDLKKGERVEVALWPHKTGGGFSVKLQDPRIPEKPGEPLMDGGQRGAGPAPASRGRAPLLDDDIPF